MVCPCFTIEQVCSWFVCLLIFLSIWNRLHYRPVSPPSYDVEESSRRIFQFNSEAFSDIDMEDSENEEPVGRLKGSTQPESHLYKYHETQFSNSVVCNSQHSSSETPTISPSPSPSSSLTTSKPASQPKEVNIYLVSNNGSYSEYINDDLNESASASEVKLDYDLSDPPCMLNDDLIHEQPMDLMNCDPRVSKLDSSNRTRSTSDGAPLGNNVPINNGGSDYLHLDGTEHFPLQPSSTSVNETDPSASNSVAPLDSKAGIVSSSANATLNSTPNTFSTSHYKSMKLTNNRSLHPTDVTWALTTNEPLSKLKCKLTPFSFHFLPKWLILFCTKYVKRQPPFY